MKDFMEMLKNKKKGAAPMPEAHKKAKMGVLKEISDMASKDMGEGMKGMKKVSVMAPDQAGLEKGLDLAKKVAKGDPSTMEESDESAEEGMEDPKEEASESPAEEASEEAAEKSVEDEILKEADKLDDESIDELIALLKSKKKGS